MGNAEMSLIDFSRSSFVKQIYSICSKQAWSRKRQVSENVAELLRLAVIVGTSDFFSIELSEGA
jgi:hypothetical protein